MRLHGVRHKPFQTVSGISKVVIFLQVYVTQMCANEIHGKYAPFPLVRLKPYLRHVYGLLSTFDIPKVNDWGGVPCVPNG
jgi:hypothetical protein